MKWFALFKQRSQIRHIMGDVQVAYNAALSQENDKKAKFM